MFIAYCYENIKFENNKSISATMMVKSIESTGTISNNEIVGIGGETYFGIIHANLSTVTISGNMITKGKTSDSDGNLSDGIKVIKSKATISGNTIYNYNGNANGIYIGTDSSATVKDNTIGMSATNGIKLDETAYCELTNNKTKAAKVGIYLLKIKSGCLVGGNTITGENSRIALLAQYCSGNTLVRNNTVSGSFSDVGIEFIGSSGDICYNNVSGTTNEAIMLYGDSGHYVTANVIGNTAKSKTSGKADIFFISYCKDSKVGLNTTGSGGVVLGRGVGVTKVSSDPTVKNKWVKVDGKWYYYDEYSRKVTGWKKISGYWYYFDSTGVMTTGWKKINDKYFYFDTNGHMTTGWKKINDKYFYFDTNGYMTTGWKKINDRYFYFNPSGSMVTGWKKINDRYFYFNPSGSMVTGWKKINERYFYFNPSGSMVTGWKKINDRYFYFNTSGSMVTGWKKIDNKSYYFNTSGSMATGWQNIGSHKFYFSVKSGCMVTGIVTIGGERYEFNEMGYFIKKL